jgi:hypothetical protein
MHSPHIEERAVTSLTALALDIAQQLDTQPGKAVVVCEHTSIVASLTKKQWAQLLRTVERAYAATLDTHKRQELSQKIAWMRSLVFSAAGKADQLETAQTDVLFCTAETLLRYAPVCQAMYITYPISHKDLHLITAWMQPEGTVVCYRIVPKQKPQVTRRSVDYKVVYETSQ